MIKTAAEIMAELNEQEGRPPGRPREYAPTCVEEGCERVHSAYGRCKRHVWKVTSHPDWQPLPPCPEPGCERVRVHRVTGDNRRTWHRNKPRHVTSGEPLIVWRDGVPPMPVGVRLRSKQFALKTRLEIMSRLLRARNDMGLTQWDVAFRMGVTQSLISDMENRVCGLNINNLQRYAKALDMRLDHNGNLTPRI